MSVWRWSVEDLDGLAVDLGPLRGWSRGPPAGPPSRTPVMPGARWFPGAEVNYAAHALRPRADGPALVGLSQTRGRVELSGPSCATWWRAAAPAWSASACGRGDRVAAYLPNIPETVVAFLATASLGAVWSSCAPEFGTRSVVDRLRQIEPTVLLAVDGYRYGAKASTARRGGAILPPAGLRATVTVPTSADPGPPATTVRLGRAAGRPPGRAAGAEFEPVPFDHPLYVLYSSGTTGLPKAIVHGHGGILLEHLKALALHHDLGPGDRFFWFSTTGWMMWNYLVSGLLVGATIVLFDGDPGHPDLDALWRMAGRRGRDVSAPRRRSCWPAAKRASSPAAVPTLRAAGRGLDRRAVARRRVRLGVRGRRARAPVLGQRGHRRVHRLRRRLSAGAGAGGRDLVPLPGRKVEAFDEAGRPVVGEQGELVVTAPMPSMPVGFWGDDDGAPLPGRLLRATTPACGPTATGSLVPRRRLHHQRAVGRHAQPRRRAHRHERVLPVVEELPEVADSLVVHLEDPDGGPGRLVLFVALARDALDDDLGARIARRCAPSCRPATCPTRSTRCPGVPRTLSGKKLEVPVKRILPGADPDAVASRGGPADPAVLDAYTGLTGSA